MSAVSVVHPIAGYTIKGVQAVYGLSIRREILFPAGTDLQLQIVASIHVEAERGVARLADDDGRCQIAGAWWRRRPCALTREGKTPSDITNLMFLGSRQQLLAAFGEAGWFEADDFNVRSAAKTVGRDDPADRLLAAPRYRHS